MTADLAPQVGIGPACRALAVSRATFYRRFRTKPGPSQPRPKPARALSKEERDEVLEIACSKELVDRSPAAIVATLLDQGRYLCSERTIYRVLSEEKLVRERRNQLAHPQYAKPCLLATGPNQVWSWDITKLLGPTKWTYFYLYVILDIYSRCVVGWMIADRENSALARRLIEETCAKHAIRPSELVLHSDRGAPMTAKNTAQLLAELGVVRSLSRPRVSDDNPFSESHFKTLKYRPSFPLRFSCIEEARSHCRDFFIWYNQQHRHSSLALLAPADVHHGRANHIIAARQRVLDKAFTQHPERFVHGRPRHPELPREVWINPPERPAEAGGNAH